MENIYQDHVLYAKSGEIVPLLKNGKALHSHYYPQKEYTQLFSTGSNGFAVFAGLGGGYQIRAFLAACPSKSSPIKALVIEKNRASLESLFAQCLLDDLRSDIRIIWCTLEDSPDISAYISHLICSHYMPALYGGFTLFPLRPWADSFTTEISCIQDAVTHSLALVSQDYSVQSHFGKVWQRNIFANLSFSREILIQQNQKTISFPIHKKAAIIAAGPSLDTVSSFLRENRKDWYIIATDTALQALTKQGIRADVFVSIDGQIISYEQVMQHLHPHMIAVIDLCAHPETARRAHSAGCSVIFTTNAHPLCRLALRYATKHAHTMSSDSFFPFMDSSSGTVTLAAADFAQYAGFSDIHLYAADFAYVNHKPYAKGTYLDEKYAQVQCRFLPIETQYTSLMLRTALLKTPEGIQSSQILLQYRNEAERFMKHIKEKHTTATTNTFYMNSHSFPYKAFIEYILDLYNKIMNHSFIAVLENDEYFCALSAILPYIAWIRAHPQTKNTDDMQNYDVFSLFKLANNCISRYNKSL